MKKVITTTQNNDISLYIHIPFCEHICAYCDFCKIIYYPETIKKYLSCLKKELQSYGIKKYQTIYIGGGTPTSLSVEELRDLLSFVSPYLSYGGEFTIEGNIENTNKEKLLLFKEYGINRLSFGVQSFSIDILQKANRFHTPQDTIKIIKLAKDIGFQNINIDLIYGFKEQTQALLKEDLKSFLSLNINHISLYSLTVPQHTLFYNQSYEALSEDESRAMYDLIYQTLTTHGFHRYEVSNFAIAGYESRHNQVYWHNKEYIGIGLGASGYYRKIRYTNTKSMNNYLNGKTIHEKEEVTISDEIFYEIMLGLRLEEGLDLLQFKEQYGKDNYQKLMNNSTKFINDNLLIIKDNHLFCSYDGMMILDYILRSFIDVF